MLGSVLLLIAAAVAVFALYKVLDARFTSKGLPLPSIPGHWLLGNIPQIAEVAKAGLHLDQLLVEWMTKYGKLFVLKLGPIEMVAVLEPEAIKEVVATKNYPKSFTYAFLAPFIGSRSLLIADQEVWHKQRRAFNPGFSYQFLKTLVPVFADKTSLLLNKLERVADSETVIKFHEVSTLLTMDIICDVVFSRNFHFQDGESYPKLYHLFTELLDISAWYGERPHMFWMRNIPFFSTKINKMQAELDSLVLEIIEEKVAEEATANKAPTGGHKDILSLVMEMAKSEGGLDKLDAVSQVKTFIFAGHDTTATTLAFAVYELSKRPDAEARLVAEIAEFCKDRTLDAETLNQMKYLNCIVKEILRMWPPGGTARFAPKGTTLQGYDVGGKVLYIPHYPLQRDPDVWGADANEFKPERWLDDAKINSMHAYAYQPFSKGPRDCIGQTFALLEAKTVLAMLYAKYTFTFALDHPEQQGYKITTHPKYGVPVRVHRRQWRCV